MDILSIIDKIYENKYFTNVFLIANFALALLFIVILVIGLKDSKKAKQPKKELKEEELKDVTFDLPTEKEKQEEIKEDVTFELPVLTDDLENFKKDLEEEIEKAEEIDMIPNKNTKELEVATRPLKILDMKEIEDTTSIDTEIVNNEAKKSRVAKHAMPKENKTVKESKYNSKDNF